MFGRPIITQILKSITSQISLEKLSELILEGAISSTQSEKGAVGYIQANRLIILSQKENHWRKEYMISELSHSDTNRFMEEAIKDKKPIIVNEKTPEFSRLLIFPVQSKERVEGLICVAGGEGEYTSQDLEYLEMFASLFILALYKKKDEDKIRQFSEEVEEIIEKRTYELEILYELSQKIPNIFSWDGFFRLFFSYLYQVIKYNFVGCWVKVEGSLKVYIGKTGSFDENSLKEFIAYIQETQIQYELISESIEGRIKFIEVDKERKAEGLNTYIHLPLRINEKIKGFVCIGFSERVILDEYELRFFDTLVHQIALSLERLEILIKTQERELSEIIERLPEGIIIIDEERRIILFNPQAERILSFSSIKKGEILEKIGEVEVEKILGRQEIVELEISYPKRLFLEIMTGFLEKGIFKKRGWVILLRDVTQQKEKEMYFEQQRRLAIVGQLAGGIAHQFNNILNVIIVTADAILVSNPHLDEETKRWLKNIKEEGRRAADLVYRLLDFSRHSLVEKRKIELFSFIKNLEKELREFFPPNVEICIERDQKSEYSIQGDPSLLRQLFLNLASNSKDAMPEGGKFILGLKELTVDEGNMLSFSTLSQGKYIEVKIEDTGIGMDEETKKHALEPFFSTKKKASGLGLSQVHGIVKQHRGIMKLESQPSQGTKVIIYLPEYETKEKNENSSGYKYFC